MRFLLILLSLYSNCILAQEKEDPIEIYNSHKFSCDSETTTLETNICLGTKLEFVDSLLNLTYHKIISDLDEEIGENNDQIKILRSKKVLTNEQKDDLKYFTNNINQSRKIKQAIIKSQHEWIRLRDSNQEVSRVMCEGGTACNGEVSQSSIDDTLERIKKLREFR